MSTRETGLSRKARGVEDVLAAADAVHRAQAAEALREAFGALLDRGEPFTADDVRRLAGDPEAHHPNYISALFAQAAQRGRIRQVGAPFRSARKSRNAGLTRRWTAVRPPFPNGKTE